MSDDMVQLGIKVAAKVKAKIIAYTREISKTPVPYTNRIGYTYNRKMPITQGEFIEMCLEAWEREIDRLREQKQVSPAAPQVSSS